MKRVLVCDDDDGFRQFVVRVLELNGCQCLEAADGGRALEALEAGESFELALVDLLMPVVSGWEVIGELERRCPEARIVAVTGLAPAEAELEKLRARSIAVLTKDGDFSVDRFLKLIQG